MRLLNVKIGASRLVSHTNITQSVLSDRYQSSYEVTPYYKQGHEGRKDAKD